jgi:uncharacterized protein
MTTASTEYAKFLPEGIPSSQMPFWESLKAKAVQVQRCDNCGAYLYIPKDICNHCHSEQLTWTPISGHGEVYTYTVVRRAPTPAYAEDAPYTLVHVTMDEGFRMIAKLNGVAPEDVRIGMPVHITYQEVTPEWTLMEFEPAPAAAGAER